VDSMTLSYSSYINGNTVQNHVQRQTEHS